MPYNFVPLRNGKTVVKPVYPHDGKLLEGKLHCTIEISPDSPLFIPNTTGDGFFEKEEQKIREFNSYETLQEKPTEQEKLPARPIIPGSSIRGVLRSVYEAASNGCMSVLGEKYVLSTRQPFARLPGILHVDENGKYTLQPAKRFATPLAEKDADGKRFLQGKEKRFYTGDAVIFETKKDKPGQVDMDTMRSDQNEELAQEEYRGVVLAGEPFAKKEKSIAKKGKPTVNKESDAVFVPVQKQLPFPIHAEDVDAMRTVLNLYASDKVNKHKVKDKEEGHSGYKGYDVKLAKMPQGLPVYYMILGAGKDTLRYADGTVRCFLAPASLSRNVYQNTIAGIADKMGHYQPCTGAETVEEGNNGEKRTVTDLCPACSLFGMVGGQKGRAYGSRIRVTDANAIAEITYAPFRTIAPLMEPNISSTEFYTNAPKCYAKARAKKKMSGWTYDYASTDGTADSVMALEDGEPQIKGRKFYWHHAAQTFKQQEGDGALRIDERFTPRIRPISHGTFAFDLYLDGVTEQELKRLIAVIRLKGSNWQGSHKLGSAKPLGYGSVRMDVRSVELRTVELTPESIQYRVEDKTEKYADVLFDKVFAAGRELKDLPDLQALMRILDPEALMREEVAVQYYALKIYKDNRNMINKLVIKDAQILPDINGLIALLDANPGRYVPIKRGAQEQPQAPSQEDLVEVDDEEFERWAQALGRSRHGRDRGRKK